MNESPEIQLSKPTQHPNQVKNYIKAGLDELGARRAVAGDLTLDRVRRDIRKKNQELMDAQEKSLVDPLTGLYNRRGLLRDDKAKSPLPGRLDQMLAHSERVGESLSLIMVDLDHFKEYNDSYGHPSGDKALCILAETIIELCRKADFPVRYGGEEFVIVLPSTTNDQGLILAERLRKAVEEIKGLKEKITISAGVATYDPKDQEIKSSEELIKQADELLYLAKKKRNCIVGEKS